MIISHALRHFSVSAALLLLTTPLFAQDHGRLISSKRSASPLGTCSFPVIEEAPYFAVDNGAQKVASADVNSDGNPDAVTVNLNNSTVSVLFGNGAGSFLPRVDSLTTPRPHHLSLGHLNNDSHIDLVVIGEAGGNYSVTMMLGDGQGHFAISDDHDIYNPQNVKIANVDSDDHADIIVIAGDSVVGKMAVYRGNGNGTFAAPTIRDIGNATSSLDTDDFNRDGNTDIAYSTSSRVVVWTGDGMGGFSESWSSPQERGQVFSGNFDRDRIPDLAVMDETFHRVRLLKGSGNGTFVRTGSSLIGEVPTDAVVADVDSNGTDDFISSNFASNEFSVLLSLGNGSFSEVVNYSSLGESRGVSAADYDGDGFVDVIATGSVLRLVGGSDSSIRLTKGNGDGSFRAPINYKIFESSYPRAIQIGDVTNDGRDDVIIANGSNWSVSVFPRIGAFKFGTRRDYLTGPRFFDLLIKDLNGDGKQDILGVGGPFIQVLLGNGSGFDEKEPFSTANYAVAVDSGDLDLNGTLDIVVANRDWGRFTVYSGFGDGTFSPGVEYSVGLDPVFDVAIADFDGNGRPDIAALYDTGISVGSKFQVWHGQTNGTFLAGGVYPFGTSIHPNALALGDLNQDGKTDVAVTIDYDPTSPANVRRYLGNGDGTFSYLGSTDVDGWHPNDLAIADLNLDGRPDVVTLNDGSENISVLEGLGSGSLVRRQLVSAGEQARKIAVGHLNQDSSPDLVVANYAGSSFTIFPNDCSRLDERDPTLFDFDGDGMADQAVFRPAEGVWYLLQSRDSALGYGFGLAGDRLTAADYDGDGRTDPAIYREGVWWVLNSNGTGHNAIQWGIASDIPVATDYDGDGKADRSVYRDGTWWILFSSGAGYTTINWGIAGDKPVPADYDGDGKADFAVYRNGEWWILFANGSGYNMVQSGWAGDIPVPADYDGDGRADIAFYREGEWSILSGMGQTSVTRWGEPGDVPVPADYDGDGRTDISIYRNGEWWTLLPTGYTQNTWGIPGDIPVSGR